MIPAPKAEFSSERAERIFHDVLKRKGVEPEKMKLKVLIPGLFFKPYQRRVVARPEKFEMSEPHPDELYPGKFKVRVSFVLSPGAYATVLLKRFFATSQ